MDVIRELQRKLAAAQEVSNKNRISERNCIDLVQKLIQLDHVKLIHTTTGKEWLTPDQLDREVRDALASNGGRLSITEIPNEVGVDISHCEARVEALRKKDSSLSRMQGDLLSTQYLQEVASEIDESLQEAGCLSVSDLAYRYNLPANFIRESVLEMLSASERNVAKQNTVYTGAHAARVEARVRGALRGCTQPITTAQLAQRHRLDPDLVAAAVTKCIHDGHVQGKLQGMTFTPKSFAEGQADRVDSFFRSNGYLPASVAKSAGTTLKEWAAGSLDAEGGALLTTAYVASHLVESALAPISEAVVSEGWIDAQPLLPTALGASDARDLLQHLASRKRLPPDAVLLDRAVFSRALLRNIAATFGEEAKVAAQKVAAGSATSSKPAGKKAKQSVVEAADSGDDDDGGAKRRGKRGGAKSRRPRGGGDEEDDRGVGAGDVGGGDVAGIDGGAIRESLAERFPEVPADLHDELCAQLQPLLAAMVTEAQESLRSSLQTKQKAQFDQAEKLVQERYEALFLGYRALEATKLQDSALYAHLLRETAAEPLHQLLALRWEEETGTTMEVTAASRKQCLDKLVAKQGAAKVECLTRFAALFTRGKEEKEIAKDAKPSKEPKASKSKKGKRGKGDESDDDEGGGGRESKEPADPPEVYHAAANDCHIFCRKVDKKREKAALQEQRVAVRQLLNDEALSDATQICHLGLQMATFSEGVPGLLFPAELWALRLVAKSLASEEARTACEELCGLIEKGDDAVSLEAKVAAWRRRALGGES